MTFRKILVLLLAALFILSGCAAGKPAGETPGTEPVPQDGTAETETDTAPAGVFGEQKIPLRFREDGTFRVLVISDIHGSGARLPAQITNSIAMVVDREDPDLVIFDGDNTWGEETAGDLASCVADMTAHIEEKEIPWCHVYGNHDAEGKVTKEEQQAVYESFAHCVSEAGPEELAGIGNYVLPVYAHDGDEVKSAVWALDSGMYLDSALEQQIMPVFSAFKGHEFSDYAHISAGQVVWYYETSLAIEKECGHKVPGMMAFHIPLQECYNAWMNRDGIEYTGSRNEDFCAGEINSGLYAAVLERGDIGTMVFGHDHTNDFALNYGGVMLCGASTVSPLCYWNPNNAGARVVVLHEDGTSETYISYLHLKGGPLPSFEGETLLGFEDGLPAFNVSGTGGSLKDEVCADEIEVIAAPGRGRDGSGAIGITRSKHHASILANTFEVKTNFAVPGLPGESRYLRFWMDLTGDGTAIDFRRASVGLIESYLDDLPYRLNGVTSFWYLPEDGDEWQEMKTDGDGCFGTGSDSSVLGLKGWFAFPLEALTADGEPLTSDTALTGLWFSAAFSNKAMAGNHIYIDDVALTADYRVFG